jgi:hypothetical protein
MEGSDRRGPKSLRRITNTTNERTLIFAVYPISGVGNRLLLHLLTVATGHPIVKSQDVDIYGEYRTKRMVVEHFEDYIR